MSYSIAIAHSKGGTGKTTTATQLVDALNIKRIADIDIHKGLSVINSLRPEDRQWDILDISSKEQLAKAISETDQKGSLLIDCGGFDSEMTRVAIALADLVLTPANDDITEQLGLASFNRTLAEISQIKGEKIVAHVLMTRVHPARKNFKAITDAINKLEHLSMMESHLSSRAIYPSVMAESGSGVTSHIGTNHSEAGKEVRKLAEEVKLLIRA
ncbi:ParA family protein [Salmonella enterica]|uniref:ParA family protein n=1 Tax=Salmonella enterica TaxID=28901 RepID=A0A5U2GF38_SALER|nr:division plane positioning ATPase MipZ [Klebsiella pneumoniae]EAR9639718.1 ParA family protein [Salmonella enterica]EHZ3036184.1 ParA family protein [Salmonella enterica subsp. enterica serovar Oranienburg]EAS6500090.1 ParA family protein [Salmonella enterica]EBP0126893.1 ParA family protein [Salmonella enterica]EEO5744109.1 ParA family protein [Salmonella enterica]